MLHEHEVAISKKKVSDDEVASIKTAHEADATMAELEKTSELSRGLVFRALHRDERKL